MNEIMRTFLNRSAAVLVVVAASGCGDVTPQPGNTTDVAGPAATQNRLEAMSQGERDAVFLRAIRDSNQPCQHVESSARAGEHQGLPLWTARCDNGVTWTIVIGNDGSAAVLNPAEAAQLDGNSAGGNRQ